MREDSFERFYYQKVALSEGCGCAEHIIATRDLDAWWLAAARRSKHPGALRWTAGRFRQMFGSLSTYFRKARADRIA